MSLWDKYQQNASNQVLIESVTDSMTPLLSAWLYQIAEQAIRNPYDMTCKIKNIFRIDQPIPRTRPNNYLDAPPQYKFMAFIMAVGRRDPELFFTILDYILQQIPARYSHNLGRILDDAGHKYMVNIVGDQATVTERIKPDEIESMNHLLASKSIYASEFHDAFVKMYSTNPDYTQAAGEAFQSLESALKHFLGESAGANLGALLGWLRDNRDKWSYDKPSDGQTDAEEHFISLVDFVNKSFRKVKHGQSTAKLTVDKEHAGAIIRATALIIYELENTIQIQQ